MKILSPHELKLYHLTCKVINGRYTPKMSWEACDDANNIYKCEACGERVMLDLFGKQIQEAA